MTAPRATPVGPDTFLSRLVLGWKGGPLESRFSAEYRIKGSQSGLMTYDRTTLDPSAWLWPSAPTTTELAFDLGGLYRLDAASVVTGSLSTVIPIAGALEFSASLGYGRRLGIGASPTR